jgi:4a-hydroxytetrahydrobiopterin dehydratase
MNQDLLNKKCVPCEGGIAPLKSAEIQKYLKSVPAWRVVAQELDTKQTQTLQRTMFFDNFRQAMAFLREVEEIAESEGHHPDFCFHYNKVNFTLWTHAIGGLHENDFILASKIDALKKD